MSSKSPLRITRRQAVASLIAGGSLLALRDLLEAGGPDDEPLEAVWELTGGDAAQRIGLLYLETFPEERSFHDLTENVLAVQGDAGAPRDVRQRLIEAIRGDFREGRTVTLAGWLLSRTEARLCAAFALATAGLPGSVSVKALATRSGRTL